MKNKKTDELLRKPIKRRTLLKSGIAAAAGVVLSPVIKISPVGATGVVNIGFPSGLTGYAAPWVLAGKRAVDLIVEEVNAAGGIKGLGGAKIKVLYADTQSNLTIHQKEVEKMITVYKTMFFISPASGLSMVGSAVTEKHGASMLSYGVADELTQRGYKHFFRIVISGGECSRDLVAFAWHMYKNVGKKFTNVAVLHMDDQYGASTGRVMEAESKKHPEWRFVERIVYPTNIVDASGYVSRLKSQNVELLFESASVDAGVLIVRAMKSTDYTPHADLQPSGAFGNPNFTKLLGKDADYFFDGGQFCVDMLSRYPKPVQDFRARFVKRYGIEMDEPTACAATIMATYIDAFERAKSTDPVKVRDALATTNLKVGDSPYIVAGPGVKFDEAGNNIGASAFIYQIRDGSFKTVWPEAFKTTEPIWPAPKWRDRT